MNAQAGEPKYWAFISYSHRDAGVASTLQRALETYRLPKRLAGTTTAAGVVPAYLKPVFRDRDEMQAGADLKATVREALAQSRYLVVVCSPDAARSQWVNQEVVEFKKLHGENRVLALITAGEPFASNMPGREAEECFPPAMRFALNDKGQPKGEALEPVAADLRPQGDGKRLATLKLIAGIVGVGVDELVRRDAQRRARRLAYVASGALAGMAVMAVLTVLAVQSRIEAQSQRAQAEDLIEFMLGDLRKKLDPVGRLDVLDSVGEKALGYYAKQDANRLDPNALGRRSRAMHLIGEMREKQGHFEEALSAFNSASDTTAELLARSPADGQRIYDHAQSMYWIGYIARRRGQPGTAEQSFLKYRDLAQQLVKIDSNNGDWRLETAYANENLGVVQLEQWRLSEALLSFDLQRDTVLQLMVTKPSLAFELAEAYGWISKTLEASGKYSAAIKAQQERLDVLGKIVDSGKNRLVQQKIANANYELGRLLLIIGDPSGAESYSSLAVTSAGTLVALDPANAFWLSELSFDEFSKAEIEFALGKRADANKDLADGAEFLNRLDTGNTSNLKRYIGLKGRELSLEAQFSSVDKRRILISSLIEYLNTVKRSESNKTQLDANQIPIIASVEVALGDELAAEGRKNDARSYWQGAVTRLRPLAEHDNYFALSLMGQSLMRLGEISEASAQMNRVKSSDYRHPIYADLAYKLTRMGTIRQQPDQPGRN